MANTLKTFKSLLNKHSQYQDFENWLVIKILKIVPISLRLHFINHYLIPLALIDF